MMQRTNLLARETLFSPGEKTHALMCERAGAVLPMRIAILRREGAAFFHAMIVHGKAAALWARRLIFLSETVLPRREITGRALR
jgi:hypothetical protein